MERYLPANPCCLFFPLFFFINKNIDYFATVVSSREKKEVLPYNECDGNTQAYETFTDCIDF